MNTVDVIIPTYKPGKKLENILKALHEQTYKVNRIIIINTEKQLFVDAYKDENYFDKYDDVDVYHITREEFDHAATRSYGVSLSKADMFIMMTDDAIPKGKRLVEELVTPIISQQAEAVYGRQCVNKNANIIERFTRLFNYPLTSRYKTAKDMEELGIKTFFFSDVCAAYNRKIFDSLGGYTDRAIFNEDMIYACSLIENGHTIYYNANARVEHYHKYTNMDQLRRNFDLGASQAMHPEVFANIKSTGEGVRLVKETAAYLVREGKLLMVPGMLVTSAYKYAGFWLGKRYEKLPKKIVLKITMNKIFWNRKF